MSTADAAGGGSMASRLPCHDNSASAERLEEVLDDVAADRAPEVRALQVRVTEVEAAEDTRPVDVLDHVLQAVVLARRPGDPTVEREGDLVGAEERVQGLDHGGAVAGVRRRVLREVRRRA